MDSTLRVLYRRFLYPPVPDEIDQYAVGNTVILNLTCKSREKDRYYYVQYELNPNKFIQHRLHMPPKICDEPCTSAGKYGGLPIKARRV